MMDWMRLAFIVRLHVTPACSFKPNHPTRHCTNALSSRMSKVFYHLMGKERPLRDCAWEPCHYALGCDVDFCEIAFVQVTLSLNYNSNFNSNLIDYIVGRMNDF